MMKAKLKGKAVLLCKLSGINNNFGSFKKKRKKKKKTIVGSSMKLVFTSKLWYMFLPLEVTTKAGFYTSKGKSSRLS